MNPKAQPDLHPEADLLSAFAEHALPEAERTRILGHMAGCARCREVVFLAQSAAEPPIMVAPAQGARPHPGRFSAAFARWRVALIPAAAMAAVGAVMLWVRLHPAPASMQMAQMVATPSAPASAATDRMTPQSAVTAHPDRPVAPPAAAPSAKAARRERQAHKAPDRGFPAREELVQNQPPPAPVMDRKRAVGAVHLDGRSAAQAMQAPPVASPGIPPDLTLAAAQPQMQQQEARRPQAANSLHSTLSAPAPAPVPPGAIAVHGAAMAPAAGGPQPFASTGAQMVLTPETTNGLAMMRLARPAKLPSGLNAVSSAAMLNRLVALDSAGAVFLSADGGKHWEAVAAQWGGKAIQVKAPLDRLYRISAGAEPSQSVSLAESAPVEAGQNESVQPSSPAPPKSKAAPPALPMLFRLVTDRHQTWVSADGKFWREQ